MTLRGRRIHLVGSAAPNCAEAHLAYAHDLVQALACELNKEGANFMIPFGKEPFLAGRSTGPSIIFDWTVAQTVAAALAAGTVAPKGPNGRLVTTLATDKLHKHMPPTRRPIFEELQKRDAMNLEFCPPGWSAGAVRRQRQAQLGDIMIAISGGEGTEHLAEEYLEHGKPVVPLDLELGASSGDGSGGATKLFGRALADPAHFFQVTAGNSAASLLDQARTLGGTRSVLDVAQAIVRLLLALVPPRVFYVRMLNDSLPEYPSVEGFFRNTVDPFVRELGYEPLQMGIGPNDFAWMNKAIFDLLHRSAVAFVDLTGLRPNCFMELGYALGHQQRIIVATRDDTRFPFDAFALEAFQWKLGEDPSSQRDRLRTHWERNIDMPTLVRPKSAT